MGRPKKKDSEVDFTDNGKFKDDPPIPGQGHNIAALNNAVRDAERGWNDLNDRIDELHAKKKEIFAHLKAEYGLTRRELEWGFKQKALEPEVREKTDEQRKIICDALGIPLTAVQPDMFGGEDVPVAAVNGKAGQEAAALN